MDKEDETQMYRRMVSTWNPIRLFEKEFVYRVQNKLVVEKDEVFPEIELISRASFNLQQKSFKM